MLPAPARPSVGIYGARWCDDTSRSLRLLSRLRVPFSYRDIDLDLDALREARGLLDGPLRTPVVVVGDRVLAEPDSRTLVDALTSSGTVPASDVMAWMHDHNVGDLDRLLRAGAAIVACALSARMPALTRWPLCGVAAVLALTAARGWCPVYDRLQVTSRQGPGDRPAEADRTSWLATTPRSLAWSAQ